jgi:hypothetical protein
MIISVARASSRVHLSPISLPRSQVEMTDWD